jgi:signal transduction histidine kinase
VLALTLVVSVILLASLFTIYKSYDYNRRQNFDNRLWAHAYNGFINYYNLNNSDSAVLAKLAKYLPGYPINFHFALIDNSYHLIKTVPQNWNYKIDTAFLQKVKAANLINSSRNKTQSLAMHFNKDGKEAFVIVSGHDKYAIARLASLKLTMVIVATTGIILTAVFAFFYVRTATRPLIAMSLQMRHINENTLKQRVKIPRGSMRRNEMVQIATNYNNMLDRLEKAFQLQKNFVHHASHELRTPLATMLSQTESALRKELTVQDAYKVLQSLKEDQQEMIDLTNSLLLLSQYENINYSIHWPKLRIDELVHDVIITVRKMFPDIKIHFDFVTAPEKESYLYFPGNETLLRSAFRNLIKNAYLYSPDKTVTVTMEAFADSVYIRFENKGSVLNPEDKERMFLPFFRGDNAQRIKGFGLGLSIVKRIAELHKGSILYEAIADDTNRFTLLLKRA